MKKCLHKERKTYLEYSKCIKCGKKEKNKIRGLKLETMIKEELKKLSKEELVKRILELEKKIEDSELEALNDSYEDT